MALVCRLVLHISCRLLGLTVSYLYSCTCGLWFKETEQRRKSALSFWEVPVRDLASATRMITGNSISKRKLTEDIDDASIGSSSKRHKSTHSGEAEFKYVGLADISREGATTQENNSSPSPPSPLQAATIHKAEIVLPKGICRYILLVSPVGGQRCGCLCFSHNLRIHDATCNCGHLACFHSKDPEASSDHGQKLDSLKSRLRQLEDRVYKNGMNNGLSGHTKRKTA